MKIRMKKILSLALAFTLAFSVPNPEMLVHAEEAGEVSGLVKRTLRNFEKDKSAQNIDRWVEELGDVLWYVTAVASIMEIPLEYIWEQNCKKLEARYGGLN